VEGVSLRNLLIVIGLALLGLLAAASIGYASYLVSRDSVGLPVTKLEDPQELTPRPRARARPVTVPTRTSTNGDEPEERGTTTGEDRPREPGDDNSGRGSSGSGSGSSGSGSSGSGGRGRGGDDD
jgi:uncharacterized membrane protein YgcG